MSDENDVVGLAERPEGSGPRNALPVEEGKAGTPFRSPDGHWRQSIYVPDAKFWVDAVVD